MLKAGDTVSQTGDTADQAIKAGQLHAAGKAGDAAGHTGNTADQANKAGQAHAAEKAAVDKAGQADGSSQAQAEKPTKQRFLCAAGGRAGSGGQGVSVRQWR